MEINTTVHSKGKLILITAAIAISIVMLSYDLDVIPHNTKSSIRRELFDYNDFKNKCLSADYNFTDVITNEYVLKANALFEQYLVNFTDSDPSKEQTFKDLIVVRNNTDAFIEIAKSILAPFIIFIIFALVTLIGWIVLCCCCCCKACCCFRNDNPTEPICGCQKFTMIQFLISLLGIAAVCIIGYVFLGRLHQKISSTECSLLRFYLDLKDGEQDAQVPYWVGVDNIITKLTNLADEIDHIDQNSKGAFKDTSFTEQDKQDYNNDLDTSYNSIKDWTVVSPNPNSNGKKITPGFISVRII